jgi:hypothetical protein
MEKTRFVGFRMGICSIKGQNFKNKIPPPIFLNTNMKQNKRVRPRIVKKR